MRVTSTPPWRNVKCPGCSAGLEIELDDICLKKVGHDYDEGDDIHLPYVTCPVCKTSISLAMKNVPMQQLRTRDRERQRRDDHDL